MLIDTHCHLDDKCYDGDIQDIIYNAKINGISNFIIPGADPKTLPRAIELSEKYAEIYFAVGVHPYHALDFNESVFCDVISHKKCIGVGECGLDYYRLPENEDEIIIEKKLQKDIFIKQILIAKEYNKPLIVHIREASLDARDILLEYAGENGGVLHCYNADAELLGLASKNFYFGIGGVLTFQNAKKLINIYPKIPKDRILVETDSPYLTPHPHRGKRNEPAYCKYIGQKMALLSGCSYEEIVSLVAKNTKDLFRGLQS